MRRNTKKPDLSDLWKKVMLTPAEAVALGYFASVKAAALLRCRGRGPAFVQDCPGGRILYRAKDLAQWAEARRWNPGDLREPVDGAGKPWKRQA